VDEADIQDDIDRTTAIGIENAEILTLAANWCENIGVTRGPMGVGLVEQVTGLPVGGGSLRCSHAHTPTSFGMQLKFSAADFYQENCIGCTYHKPTGRSPNLGAWADAVLAERGEQARMAAEERRVAEEKRRERTEQRRFLLGTPDPAVQAILDLVERIDAEAPDPEAELLLLKHAELSPQDFPDALLSHLASEGLAIGRGPLLEVVFSIFERAGRPSPEAVLGLAFAAVRDDVAAQAASSHIAQHATEFPPDERTRMGLVRLAAGIFDFRSDWIGARPEALLRLFDIDPLGATDTVAALLRDPEPWARATAAHAAQALIRNRPTSHDLLLSPLLDCVLTPDRSRYHGDPWASSKAADVVGDILIAEPGQTDAAIVARLQGQNEGDARALWQCYWHASPSRFRAPVPPDAIGVIERRAVALLNEDRPIGFLERVAETLSNLTDDHDGSAGVAVQDLIDLLLVWTEKHREAGKFQITESTTPLEFLESQNRQLRIGAVARSLEKALKGRVKADLAGFVATIAPIWDAPGSPPLVDEDRASLLDALGTITTQEQLDAAQTLLELVLSNGETAERAAALEVLEEIQWRDLDFPRPVQQLVVANLFHEKLWVAIHAIRALPMVDVDPADQPKVTNYLLSFAHNYKGEPLRSDDVERALGLALGLAEGQPHESQVAALALQIVNAMATTDAVDPLIHLRRLRSGPEWVAAVIRALEPDERSAEWFGLHEMKKEELLEALTEAPREWLEPHWDALEAAAERDLDLVGAWTWAIADLLALHEQHERAARICQAVVDRTPDTREHAHRRRTAILIAYGHRIDAAVDDPAAARRLLDDALQTTDADQDSDDA